MQEEKSKYSGSYRPLEQGPIQAQASSLPACPRLMSSLRILLRVIKANSLLLKNRLRKGTSFPILRSKMDLSKIVISLKMNLINSQWVNTWSKLIADKMTHPILTVDLLLSQTKELKRSNLIAHKYNRLTTIMKNKKIQRQQLHARITTKSQLGSNYQRSHFLASWIRT